MQAIKARAATFIKKVFRVGGERFDDATEQRLNDLADRILVICKWTVRIFVTVTIYLLIFGESGMMDDPPLMWRIKYEWTRLIHNILYHFTIGSSA